MATRLRRCERTGDQRSPDAELAAGFIHRQRAEHERSRTPGADVPQPHGPDQAALGQPIWDYYREHPGEGAAFTGAMSGVSAMIAGQVAAAAAVTGSRRIVDVGGGHGTLLRALLATAPQARGVVLDLPEVAATAPPADRQPARNRHTTPR